MSTKPGNRDKKMSNDDILSFVRAHEDPCVTAGEIAEEFDATNGAVNYRLKKLEEDGRIAKKDAGASAKVWYLKG
jgi:predicted transcriptional regulator